MKILVTGVAGFIGAALAIKLLERGDSVYGIDNLNDYYDPALKQARLDAVSAKDNVEFQKIDLTDKEGIEAVFASFKPERVVNLAAQAGVRYSMDNPHAYVDANILGFLNVLEGCRHHDVEHLVFASSSSVYGANSFMPFSASHHADHPVALYGATKKANELMAHAYSNLYAMPVTGLRFFTVYGPWGRPDMSLFIFTRNILAGKPVQLFNHGRHSRDFTYIDDIVNGIIAVVDNIASVDANWSSAKPKPDSSFCPYRIYNIGNTQPVELLEFVEILEDKLGVKAIKEFLPMQACEVHATYADITTLANATGFKPTTNIHDGIEKFVAWYKSYYSG